MAEPDDKAKPAGRVKHDASGRAVWEWAADTGRVALDSTSRLLKRLELPGLKLEEDVKKKDKDPTPTPAVFGGASEKDPLADSKKNFNPYDNRSPPKRGAATPKLPAGPASRTAQPARNGKKPGFLARLFGEK